MKLALYLHEQMDIIEITSGGGDLQARSGWMNREKKEKKKILCLYWL